MSVAYSDRLTPEAERKIRIAHQQLKVALDGMHRMDALAAKFGHELELMTERFRELHGVVIGVAAGHCTGPRMPERDCMVYPPELPGCPICQCRRALERMPGVAR